MRKKKKREKWIKSFDLGKSEFNMFDGKEYGMMR